MISANHGDGILLTGTDNGDDDLRQSHRHGCHRHVGHHHRQMSHSATRATACTSISRWAAHSTGSSRAISSAEVQSGTGNVISNNGGNGIEIDGSGPTLISVLGNYIGMDISGSIKGLANGGNGVLINGAANNTIGGPGLAQQNVISGNFDNGVWLEGQGTSGNVVQNNLIGLGSDGNSIFPNGEDGIFVTGPNNLIGRH